MALRKIILPTIFIFLAYGFWISPDFKEIAAGVSIFLFGMLALEEGFKAFSGGALERILKKSTNKLYKSITFGFISTALMQSSSLVSVLTISFIGAGLIGLTQGIGIILGANIGTTTGAWLMAGFGLKVKISAYAMPMLVFGVIMIFQKSKTLKGIGYILAGLGFLFLGIHYMKEGFEAFKSSVELSSFAVGGVKGLLLYVLIGIIATVIMQSSHATIMLVLTALAVGQIEYKSAIALVIGANIGTTITAIIGSLSSNIDGKRLAAAHFIFNVTTAIITLLIINQFIDVVNSISDYLGISSSNYTLRVAVFDSLFKVLGVILFIPFVNSLVKFLNKAFKSKEKESIAKVKYLNEMALEFPSTALKASLDESKRLLKNSMKTIAKGLGVRSYKENIDVTKISQIPSIEDDYNNKIKGVYAEITKFIILAQGSVDSEYIARFNNIKLANRNTIEALKMAQLLQKNLKKYIKSDNQAIKEQYQKVIKRVIKLMRTIDSISHCEELDKKLKMLDKTKKILQKNDIVANGKLDKLIREQKITNLMAVSLMNDSAYTNTIIKSLIASAGVILIDPSVDIDRYRQEIKSIK